MKRPEAVAVARFVDLASDYCALIESPPIDRSVFLCKCADLLPQVFAAAIGLPAGRMDDEVFQERMLVGRADAEGYGLTEAERTQAKSSKYWGAGVPVERFFAISRRLARILGKFDRYRRVFDPYEDRYSMQVTLSNDLAEIWEDVKRSLLLFDLGGSRNQQHAIYEWALNVRIHWGFWHCVDALKAISHALSKLDSDWQHPNVGTSGRTTSRRKRRD